MPVGSILARTVGSLISIAVIWFGLYLVNTNSSTPDELAARSDQLVRTYKPMCDDESMSPGDVCLRFGDDSDEPGDYAGMVAYHKASVAPAELAAEESGWRIAGWVGAGVGALALALWLMGFVALVRASRGRARLAAAHGWTYQAFDEHLLTRLTPPDVRSDGTGATGVVTGTRDGLPFTLFDYRNPDQGRKTAVLLQLPTAVPHLEVTNAIGARVEPGSSAAGEALFDDELKQFLQKQRLDWFAVDGRLLVFHLNSFYSPKGPVVLTRLDAGIALGRLLVAATARRVV